jgi:hypothetical protein
MPRSITAGFVLLLGVGLVLAPAATSARSGGFAGGRASFQGALRAAPIRPAVAIPQPAAGNAAAAQINVHPQVPFRHRRHFGAPVAGWDGSGYETGYGQGPAPYLYPGLGFDEPGADGARGRVVYVPPPPGCRPDSQVVPSETGGERKITILRCWH